MSIEFKKILKDAKSLNEIVVILKKSIKTFKAINKNSPIVYVAGKVTADGSEKILPNLRRLDKYTQRLRYKYDFVFSSANVFDKETYWKLNVAKPLHEEDFYKFWRRTLKSGVTDIYMTPEWEKSTGATDEYTTAKKLNLKIHYLEK